MFDNRFVDVVYEIGQRDHQEDSYIYARLRRADAPDLPDCLILADGMGGHEGGEIAAHAAVKSCFRSLSENMYRPAGAALEGALQDANQAVWDVRRKHKLDESGCTLIAAYVRHSHLHWVSVGDSLLLHFRNGILRRLNENHSQAGRNRILVDQGHMTQAEADQLGGGHILLSALTGYRIDMIDRQWAESGVKLEDNDIVVLASDGIETLSEELIAEIFSANSDDLREALFALKHEIQNVNDPHQDNYTILAYQHSVQDDALESFIISSLGNEVDDVNRGQWGTERHISIADRFSRFLRR